MGHPTAVLTRARERAAAAAERRAETLRLVAVAGHEAHVVTAPKFDAPSLVRVDCTCGAYRSAPGSESTAHSAWFSHARRKTQEAGVTLP